MKLKYFLVILAILFAIGLILVENSKEEITETVALSNAVYENGTINVYFCPEDDCNTIMLEEINNSEKVFCAFYDLNDYRLSNLFKEKNSSLIIHYANYDDYGFSRETNGLMHDKFCILDDKKIITGSHNPTQGKNKDNVLIIESEYLAENYAHEFENILEHPATEKEKTKRTKIIFNDYELENYFCPQDECKKEILEELKKANSSILFLTYTFTDNDISNVLVQKKNSGLLVKGAIESYQGKTYWVYPELVESDVDVVLDNEKELQHNKVFIIDNSTVITGSFNPTKAADTKNDENIIIIRQPEIVKKYIDEFNRLYESYSE